MKAGKLQRHILATYLDMRIGVAVMAFLFPLILWIGGHVIPSVPVELQPSMSAYYHTPMRNAFVGVLFIIGAFLYLYRGYSTLENQLLNVAGILAIGIALFPTALSCAPLDLVCFARAKLTFTAPKLHGYCAVIFFLCIAGVCIFCSKTTLPLIKNETRRKALRVVYIALGVAMIALPLIAAYLSFIAEYTSPENKRHVIFWVELSGVWVFATYWAVKSFEIAQTEADGAAACGKLEI